MIQWLNDLLQGVQSVRIDYDSGGFIVAYKTNAVVRYNTGDMIWLQLLDDEWKVTGIDTHDDAVIWHAPA